MSDRTRTERGGATVLVVAMAGVLVLVTAGLAAAGGLVVAQRRVQAAADLAALAAASRPDEGCVAAQRVAAAGAARLDDCAVEGREVRVQVSLAGPVLPGRGGRARLSAEARAGPA